MKQPKGARGRRLTRRRSIILEQDDDPRIVELATRLDALDDDYEGVTEAVRDVGRRLNELASAIYAKIDQRFQPQWQTWIAGAALVGGLFFTFWTAGITPLEKTQVTFAAELNASRAVWANEILAVREVIRLHAIDDRQRFDGLIDKVQDRYLSIREHNETLKRQEQSDIQLRIDLNELKAEVRKMYDVVKSSSK